MRTLLWIVLPLLVAASGCSGLGASADLGYAQFQFDGNVSYTLQGDPRNQGNRLTDDFGLDDPEGIPYLRTQLDFGGAALSASAFRVNVESSGDLASKFGSIAQGLSVDTEMELTNLRAAFYFFDFFDIIPIPGLRLKPGIGVDYFDLMIQADAGGGASERIDTQALIPIGCLQAGLEVWIFEAVVEAGFMQVPQGFVKKYTDDDYDGTFLDVEALLKFHPLENLTLFAGYRHITFDGKGDAGDNRFELDTGIRGWMVGGGLKF